MYKNSIDHMFEELASSREGLSADERNERRKDHGYNELLDLEKRSFFSFFGESFGLVSQRILILALLFFVYLGRYLEVGLFFLIFTFRALAGTIKSLLAQRTRIKFYEENTNYCRVLQEGELLEMPVRNLVPGDVVFLERGDIVPADGRLIEGDDIWVDESLLTGDSQPFCKDMNFIGQDMVPLAERANMIYASTVVCQGQALMLVTSTGMQTEIGKVAFMLYKEGKRESIFDAGLKKQGRIINVLFILLSLLIGVYGYYRGLHFMEMIFIVISLGLASTVQGFDKLVYELESRNSSRFLKNELVLKDLAAIEDLSAVSVAIFDESPYISRGGLRVSDLSTTSDEDELLMKQITVLSARDSQEDWKDFLRGLRDFALEENPSLDIELEKYELLEAREEEKTFRSTYETPDGILSFVIGGLTEVLALSTKYNDGEEILDIDDEVIQGILAMEEDFHQQGKKVLALAQHLGEEEAEGNLAFLGLVALVEGGEEGVKSSIKTLENAGVLPIMLSESSVEVGSQLAREAGILQPGYEVMTSEVMEAMTDEEFYSVVKDYTVYFNLDDRQRARLVDAWQSQGHRVALSLNDMDFIPSSEKADLVVTSLEDSSAVVKDKSQLLLPQGGLDYFNEGLAGARMVVLNMRRKVRYELVVSLAFILSSLVLILAYNELIMSFMAFIWLGMVVRYLMGMALEKEPRERNVLFRKPPNIDGGLIQTKSLVLSIFEGLLMAATVLGAYLMIPDSMGSANMSMAYLTFGFGLIFTAFSLRNSQSVLGRGFFSNRIFFLSLLISSLLVLAPVSHGLVARVFGMVSLAPQFWLLALGLAFAPVLITEVRKIFIKE